MKNYIIIVSCIALTGCAGMHTSQTRNQINTVVTQEMVAWDKVQKQYEAECPRGTPDKPLPRERALEGSDCYAKLAREYVMPVAIDPVAVMNLLAAHKRVGLEVKQGKIDRDEAGLKIQESWNSYVANLDSKATGALVAAAQKDEQLARDQQQYFQNLSTQINQAEKQNQIKNTNCHKTGNMVNCTTW